MVHPAKLRPAPRVVRAARSQGLFRRSDLTRAIRGAQDANLQIERIEIDKVTGNIVVHVAGVAKPDNAQTT